MSLKKYFKNNEKINENNKIIYDKSTIIKIEDNFINFNFEDIKDLFDYQKFLFFSPTERIIASSINDIKNFYKKSLELNLEGVMLKSLKENYKPGLRVGAMFKLKKVDKEMDLVVLYGLYGKGKRSGFISSFIVGIKDNLTDEFLEIGKVSSGLKEDEKEDLSIQNLTKELEKLKIKETNEKVIYKPKLVVEVRYQEIVLSNKYNSGYSLRFPRIVRLRKDKSVDEITTLSELENLYKFNKNYIKNNN